MFILKLACKNKYIAFKGLKCFSILIFSSNHLFIIHKTFNQLCMVFVFIISFIISSFINYIVIFYINIYNINNVNIYII